jgi:hypothetical protein
MEIPTRSHTGNKLQIVFRIGRPPEGGRPFFYSVLLHRAPFSFCDPDAIIPSSVVIFSIVQISHSSKMFVEATNSLALSTQVTEKIPYMCAVRRWFLRTTEPPKEQTHAESPLFSAIVCPCSTFLQKFFPQGSGISHAFFALFCPVC